MQAALRLAFFLTSSILFCKCLGASGPGVGQSDSYLNFGTKTSYFINADLDTSPISVPGCQPAMFWFLARHGTRNPGDDDINQMASRLPNLRNLIVSAWENGNGAMDEATIESFKEWTFDLVAEDDSLLTESGEREHEEMGSRWRKRLDAVLEDSEKVLVRATNKQRTRESGRFFLKGVFGRDVEVPPSPDIEDDLLLKFYDNCDKYKEEVAHNNATIAEVYKREESTDYLAMIDEVSIRGGVGFTAGDVDLLWNICRFEMAWWPESKSPWCKLFSEINLKIIEFRDDLKYYYKDAYAHDISWQMTQPLFHDIFQQFSSARSGQNNHTSALYFAHSETVQPFLAGLGLFHDSEDLLASSWPSLDHQWRTSPIASFASNTGLVLLQCQAPMVCLGEDCWEAVEEEWRVMALHQERRVVLPPCGKEICGLDVFMDFYMDLEQLDFDDICKV